MKTAAVVIAILLIASTIGWISSEIYPRDVRSREEAYREKWGDTVYRIVIQLKLYDPFHSFWYRSVLALFFITLSACILTGWRGYIKRSFRIPDPQDIPRAESGRGSVIISWSELARSRIRKGDITGHYEREHSAPFEVDDQFLPRIYERVRKSLRKKGYRLKPERAEGRIIFSARGGKYHYPGSLLFHIGILVITIGGLIGSFMGRSELELGRMGDRIPLFGSADSLRIEEFRIVRTDEGMVQDYLTFIRLPGGEQRVVEVNHPVSYNGYDIYQSSYYIAENELSLATLECRQGSRRELVTAGIGDRVKLSGWGWTVEILNYIPDFRFGPKGPYSAGNRMRNPAVRISVTGDFGTESGWIFPQEHPMPHSTIDLPAKFSLQYIEPAYYTGLEISRSPHAPVIIAGIAVSALGMLLLFSFRYSVLRGRIDSEGMIVKGPDTGLRADQLEKRLKGELSDMLAEYREAGIDG